MGRRRGGSGRHRRKRRRDEQAAGGDPEPQPDVTPQPSDTPPQSSDAAPQPVPGGEPAQEAENSSNGGPMSMREAVARLHTRAAGHDPDAAAAEATPEQPASVRRVSIEGEDWLVKQAGAGRAGTGALGLAHILAVRFYRPGTPEQAEREALVSAVNLERMYDDELRALFERATHIESSE